MVQVVAAHHRRLGDTVMGHPIVQEGNTFHEDILGKLHRQGIIIIHLRHLIIATILTIHILVNMATMVVRRGVTGQKMTEDHHRQDGVENTDLPLPHNLFIGVNMATNTTVALVMDIIIRTRGVDAAVNGIRHIMMKSMTDGTLSIRLHIIIIRTIRLLGVDRMVEVTE